MFYISALAGGGAERATADLAGALDNERFEAFVVLEREQAQVYDVAGHLSVTTLGVDSTRSSLQPLVHVLLSKQPDLVYSALPHLNVAASVACRIAAARSRGKVAPELVLSVHNNHELEFPHIEDGKVLRYVVPWAYRGADAIVAVSRGIGDQVAAIRGVSRDKVHVIHNPIDVGAIERLSSIPVEHPWFDGVHEVVVAMGRLSYQKDYPLMLEAFTRLRNARPNARLLILGDGPDYAELEELLAKLGLRESVELAGLCRNPFAYIARAGCFLLTSRYEGFGMALVEAMAAGAPVVATDCAHGPREILEGGRWGELVLSRSPDDVADAVARVLENHALRDKLSRDGRVRARDFAPAAVVPRLEELLCELSAQSTQRVHAA